MGISGKVENTGIGTNNNVLGQGLETASNAASRFSLCAQYADDFRCIIR